MKNMFISLCALLGALVSILAPINSNVHLMGTATRCKNVSSSGGATGGSCNLSVSVSANNQQHGGHRDNCPPQAMCGTDFDFTASWTQGCVTIARLFKNGSQVGPDHLFGSSESSTSGQVKWTAECNAGTSTFELKFFGADPTLPVGTATFTGDCQNCQEVDV